MRVRVEACSSGRDVYHRLEFVRDGRHVRLIVRRGSWDRNAAREALDLIGVECPNVARRSIRFDVH